jgi:hypothetical protein
MVDPTDMIGGEFTMKRFIRAAVLTLLLAPLTSSLAHAHMVDHHTGGEGAPHWLLDHGYIVGVGLATFTVVYFMVRHRRKAHRRGD